MLFGGSYCGFSFSGSWGVSSVFACAFHVAVFAEGAEVVEVVVVSSGDVVYVGGFCSAPDAFVLVAFEGLLAYFVPVSGEFLFSF